MKKQSDYQDPKEIQEDLKKLRDYIIDKIEAEFPLKVENVVSFDLVGANSDEAIVGITMIKNRLYNFHIPKDAPFVMLWLVP